MAVASTWCEIRVGAWEAVGEDACFYLGFGGMGRQRLTLLVAPPEGSQSKGVGVLIARVLEERS